MILGPMNTRELLLGLAQDMRRDAAKLTGPAAQIVRDQIRDAIRLLHPGDTTEARRDAARLLARAIDGTGALLREKFPRRRPANQVATA